MIKDNSNPVPQSKIESDLRKLGLKSGDLVLCHSSLSSIGWVIGGPIAVIDAIINVIGVKRNLGAEDGEEGTIIMPAHSGDYSNPAYWTNPSVPNSWVNMINNNMPPYRRDITPIKKTIGVIPECFRKYPGVERSSHPVRSFCALGRDAVSIVTKDSYDHPHGKNSALDYIYQNKGKILNIGVKNNTCFAFSEHLTSIQHDIIVEQSPIQQDGSRTLVEWKQLDYNYTSDDRDKVHKSFISESENCKLGMVGTAESVVFDAYEYIEYSKEWLSAKYNKK